MYVALTVGLTFILHLISRYLSSVDAKTEYECYRQEQWAYSEKAMSMAYESIEDRDIYHLKHQVEAKSQTGYNIYQLRHSFSNMIGALTRIIASASMSFSFFTLESVPLSMKLLTVAVTAVTVVSNVLTTSMQMKERCKFFGNNVFINVYLEKFCDYIGNYSAGKDIRLYGMGDMLAKKRAETENCFYRRSIHVDHKLALMSLPGQLLNTVLQFVLYAVLIYGALKGDVTVGSIAKYVSCVTMLLGAVTTLIVGINTTLENNLHLKQYFSYFDIPNNMYKGSLTVEKRDDREYYVEFCNVSFKYPNTDTYALRNVNIKFKVGEKLAVVGVNGSGKSTFIKLMCRLYDPTEGVILLNGVDIRKYDYDEYMSLFSVVFQDFKLFSFPLGQNVAASLDYDKERVVTCLTQAGFSSRLGEMPMGTETCLYKDFDNNGVEISGGEAQKIALARALYKDAPFFVLDEPTASLDPISEYEVYSKFNEITGDRTAVYISHRLASCRFCDNIAVFDNGSVIQFGTHDSLLADESGKYYELWHAQAQYYT
ncbi:MAG: ABC transporter ATP-binding protein [Candidatus Avispirillum sp.]